MKFLPSKKAQEKAVNLPFTILIALLLLFVAIFVILPLITKPLSVDSCLQQNGARASYCNEDVSIKNTFVDVDDANNVCCFPLPGKEKEFTLWAESMINTGNSTNPQRILQADNAAELYGTANNTIAVYLLPEKKSEEELLFKEGVEIIFPGKGEKEFITLTPGKTFDIAGVNNFADGICKLTIHKAELFMNTTYRPLATGEGSIFPPEQGFNYEKTNCKIGSGVQITGHLTGLVGADSYYILSYGVKSPKGTLQIYKLIQARLPDAPSTGTSGAGSSAAFCSANNCESFTTATGCVANNKSRPEASCPGCNWLGNKGCKTCVLSSCGGYTTEESCLADPCRLVTSKCVWSSNTCIDCSNVDECSDYNGMRLACKGDVCKLDNGCDWKVFGQECRSLTT